MYDTIGIYCHKNDAFEVPHYLSNINETYNLHCDEITTFGNFKNIKVKIKGNFISLTGSLPKYLLGNNFEELNLSKTKEAFENLSDELHLNLFDSKLFRIDVASNLIMDDSLNKYYSAFESLPRYEKKPYKNGIMYTTNKIALKFYTKKVETMKKKQPIPREFEDKNNILRYEIKCSNNLKSIFKQNIYVNDLLNEKFSFQFMERIIFLNQEKESSPF